MTSKSSATTAEWGVDNKVLNRFFPGDTWSNSIMVEVGAARPDFLSIGNRFRRAGWQVISIEPNPDFCKLHRDAGNEIIECACGSSDAENVPFTVVDSRNATRDNVSFESFSSLAIKPSYQEIFPTNLKTRQINVRMRKLSTLLDEHAPANREVAVLAIDVEGWELEVLAGLDFSRHTPKCIILENLFNDRKYRQFLMDRGYRLWRVLHPNDVYVHNSIQVPFLESLFLRYWDQFFCGAITFACRLKAKLSHSKH